MPIGEIHKSGNSFTGVNEYVLAQGRYQNQQNDKKPEIIEQNLLFSNNYKDLGREMRSVSLENKKVSKPVMHFSVNFKEGDLSSQGQQVEAVKIAMEKLDIKAENHQFMIVKHNDKHPHYHVIVNRIGLDGKTLSDSNTIRKLAVGIDKAEKVLGLDNSLVSKRVHVYDPTTELGYKLNPNREIKQGKEVVKYQKDKEVGLKEKKNFIQKETIKSLENTSIITLKMLREDLLKKGIDLDYKVNAKGQVQGSFKYQNVAVKGSAINLKGNLLRDQLEKNTQYNIVKQEQQEKVINIGKFATVFDTSIKDLTQNYNKGKTPDLKEILERNGLKYDEPNKVKYQGLVAEFNDLEKFQNHLKNSLEQEKKVLFDKLKAYQEIQNLKPKTGFLGILSDSQKHYNDSLKVKQLLAQKPQFTPINDISFRLQKQYFFEAQKQQALTSKVEHQKVYEVEKNPLEEKEIEAKQGQNQEQEQQENNRFSLAQNNRGGGEDDEEPKKKRGRKR